MQRNRRYQQTKPFVSGGVYTSPVNQQKRPPIRGTPQPLVQRKQAQQEQQQQLQQQRQQQKQEEEQYEQNQENQDDDDQETVDEKPMTPEPPILVEDNDAGDDEEMNNEENGNGNGHDNDDDDGQSVTQSNDESPEKRGKIGFKKIFLIRKKSSVRAKEKKIRQNRQLRKAITPKNALMALNEVKGIQLGDFEFNTITAGGFSATVIVNGVQYEGKGNSKISAKNDACEKALRDFVIAKMLRKPRIPRKNSEGQVVEPMDADDGQNDDKESAKNGGASDEPDDVPMLNLASFALFKLFSEWENEGFHVPEMHHAHPPANGSASNGTPVPKEPKKLPIRTELPSNWETMHPATLLCVMRPGIQYSELGSIGEKPNQLQKLGVTVDEQEFTGIGRSKKIARRNAAVSACNTLFNTNFEEEPVPAEA